jgi:hypothetical protein
MKGRFGFHVVFVLCGAFVQCEAFAQVPIYRCVVNGVVVFADRPCGDDARPYEPNAASVSSYAPVTADVLQAANAAPRSAGRREPVPPHAQRAQACARIEHALDEIRAKQRAGYSLKQGERLKARQRKLAAERRELRC